MSLHLDAQKLAKLREYYNLVLTVRFSIDCDDYGCSQGYHWSERCYTAEIPPTFTIDDIDKNGIYLRDWRQLPEAKESANKENAEGICLLKLKVNLKRDIKDLLSL
ncbi:MAG: hypothetical protein WD512_06415 [Candidatus Paceibacterota bacterium]